MDASLKSAIAEYVDGMKAASIEINTNAAAITLARHYPHSGMSTEEIIREIEEVAAKTGALLWAKADRDGH